MQRNFVAKVQWLFGACGRVSRTGKTVNLFP